LNIFEKHVKNLFWNKIIALLRSILGDFFMANFRPNHWAIFSRKKFAQRHKKLPKWWNFAQSGHPDGNLPPLKTFFLTDLDLVILSWNFQLFSTCESTFWGAATPSITIKNRDTQHNSTKYIVMLCWISLGWVSQIRALCLVSQKTISNAVRHDGECHYADCRK